jgi:hypothetical protein
MGEHQRLQDSFDPPAARRRCVQHRANKCEYLKRRIVPLRAASLYGNWLRDLFLIIATKTAGQSPTITVQ